MTLCDFNVVRQVDGKVADYGHECIVDIVFERLCGSDSRRRSELRPRELHVSRLARAPDEPAESVNSGTISAKDTTVHWL